MSQNRQYELVYIVSPDASEEAVAELHTQVEEIVTRYKGTLDKTENWGRRKLAYPIDKVNEGKYVLLFIQSPDGKNSLHEVEHRMRQNDKILRFLTVRTDEDLKRAARRNAAPSAGGSSVAVDEPDDDDIEPGEEI